MNKRTLATTWLAVITLCINNASWAGPSYAVECEDAVRGTALEMFDLNPSAGLIRAEGRHNAFPVGTTRFVAEPQDRSTALDVVRYKPYEVELMLGVAGDRKPLLLKTIEGDAIVLAELERIVLENHSEPTIDAEPRHGAAVLVLTNGQRLRFNGCSVTGDTSVQDWAGTFERSD